MKYDKFMFREVGTKCRCPDCNKLHSKVIEGAHLDSPYAWKAEFGYPMILCSICKSRVGRININKI